MESIPQENFFLPKWLQFVIKANQNTCFLSGWLEFAKVLGRGYRCGHQVTRFFLYNMLYVWSQFIAEEIHWIIPRRLSGGWASFLLIVPYPLLYFGLTHCVVVMVNYDVNRLLIVMCSVKFLTFRLTLQTQMATRSTVTLVHIYPSLYPKFFSAMLSILSDIIIISAFSYY